MRLFKFLAPFIAGLLFAEILYAAPLELKWDAVTEFTDGAPIPVGLVRYRMYKKAPFDTFKFMAETKNTRFTWLVPSIGHYVFRVTAIVGDAESEPSNELKIFVDRIGKEEL